MQRITGAAQKLFDSAIVCDLTLPWCSGPAEGRAEALAGAIEAGIDFISLTMGTDSTTTHDCLRLIAAERGRIAASSQLTFVETVDDIRRAKTVGKLAIGFHFQGAGPLANDIELIPVFYDLGVRHMILAYNQRNRFADGCNERNDGGLSRLGMRAVTEMNRVGMIVDCSHLSYLTSMQIIEYSEAPVMFSHSNAHRLVPSYRNIKDDQIKACASKGGLIGICSFGTFLTPDHSSTVEGLADQLCYVCDLVGEQHVALGLDSIYYPDVFYKLYSERKDIYPADAPLPRNYFNLSNLRYLPDLMINRGLSEKAITGILGGNFLRLASTVWKATDQGWPVHKD